MKKKQRGRLPSGRIMDYARCKGCSAKYKGTIKNAQDKIERVISCQTNCLFLKGGLVTGI